LKCKTYYYYIGQTGELGIRNI